MINLGSYHHTFQLGAAGALIFTLVCLLMATLIWYRVLPVNKRGRKVLAVLLGAFPIVGFGGQLVMYYGSEFFGWFGPSDAFRTTATGAARSEKEAVREFPIDIDNDGQPHSLDLTPKANFGESAAGQVTVSMELRSPRGEVVKQHDAMVGPDHGDAWKTATIEFTPPQAGRYLLKLVIPNPVGQVLVAIRE